MYKKNKRIQKLVVFFILLSGLLTACGVKTNNTYMGKNSTISIAETTSTNTTNGLPIVKVPITLTYFIGMDFDIAMTRKDYSEVSAVKELEKRTNIHLEFKHPQSNEAFKLMFASKDYPDLVCNQWNDYPGGIETAASDGVIVEVRDLIEKNCPNLVKLMSDMPEIRKLLTTDSGKMYLFPTIADDKAFQVCYGFQIRKDWLDKLELSVPTTFDEWYEVLKAFKDKDPNGNGKQDELPVIFTSGSDPLNDFSYADFPWGAWGIAKDFYQVEGIVKYGPLQPEYKEGLALLHQWYKEGLIDPDFATTTWDSANSKIISEQAGAWLGYTSGLNRLTNSISAKNPQVSIVACPYPTLKKGEQPLMGQLDPLIILWNGTCITTKNKYVLETLKWLDYNYGTDGALLDNYGIEGITYRNVNGQPRFLDEVLENPDGLAPSLAIAKHTFLNASWPKLQLFSAYNQLVGKPYQQQALKIWNEPLNKNWMPPITLTKDEGEKYSTIMSDIDALNNEMFIKIILGTESLENYDKYVEKLKSMKIEDIIKIEQDALNRFNNK